MREVSGLEGVNLGSQRYFYKQIMYFTSMSLKERIESLSEFSTSLIKPTQNLEIALLLRKEKKVKIEDICTIEYVQSGNQPPSRDFYNSLKLAFNPILAEDNYVSIQTGQTYCAKTARKYYRVLRMSKEEFNQMSSYDEGWLKQF